MILKSKNGNANNSNNKQLAQKKDTWQITELTLFSFVLNLIFIVKITNCNSKSYQQLKVHIIILKINKNLLISSEAKDIRL